MADRVHDLEEEVFAKRLQQPLIAEFGSRFQEAIDQRIYRPALKSEPTGGSTDVGDISSRVPTGGLNTSCVVSCTEPCCEPRPFANQSILIEVVNAKMGPGILERHFDITRH